LRDHEPESRRPHGLQWRGCRRLSSRDPPTLLGTPVVPVLKGMCQSPRSSPTNRPAPTPLRGALSLGPLGRQARRQPTTTSFAESQPQLLQKLAQSNLAGWHWLNGPGRSAIAFHAMTDRDQSACSRTETLFPHACPMNEFFIPCRGLPRVHGDHVSRSGQSGFSLRGWPPVQEASRPPMTAM